MAAALLQHFYGTNKGDCGGGKFFIFHVTSPGKRRNRHISNRISPMIITETSRVQDTKTKGTQKHSEYECTPR